MFDTIEQFVAKQVATWGEDYVFDLYDRGYVPMLTATGPRFVLVSNTDFIKRDNPKLVCV